MRQPLEMILSFRLEVAAYCIVVVEHTTVMQTQKNLYGLVRLCLRACVTVRMHMLVHSCTYTAHCIVLHLCEQ